MALKKSELLDQMNLPQIETDPYHQYVVLRELRKFGNYHLDILDPDFNYLLKEAVRRIPCITSVQDLVTLFKTSEAALLQRTQRADVEVKYKNREEDKIYLSTPASGFLHRFVQYARAGNAPLAFYFWSGVALLSAACRRKVCFQGAETVYLNMYIILGAARAAGKGQALKGLTNVLSETNNKLETMFTASGGKDYSIKAKTIFHIPSDITPEAMVTRLYKRQYIATEGKHIKVPGVQTRRYDATGILALDELGTFLGKDAFNSSKKPLFLTEIKDSEHFNKDTKKDGEEELHNTAITMIACCAPDWLTKCIDKEMLGGGFTDRCTWIYRKPDWDAQMERSIASGIPKNPLEASSLADWLIDHVLCFEGLEAVVPSKATGPRLHDIWQELVKKSQKEFEKFGLDDTKNSASRTFQGILQLASLMAVSDIPDGRTTFQPIAMTIEHVELAQAIVLKEEASMNEFLAQASRSATTVRDAKLLEFLTDMGGCVTRTNLMSKFKGHQGMDNVVDVDFALQNLFETGDVSDVTIGRSKAYRTKKHTLDGGCEKCR